jgi:hypothetical protein
MNRSKTTHGTQPQKSHWVTVVELFPLLLLSAFPDARLLSRSEFSASIRSNKVTPPTCAGIYLKASAKWKGVVTSAARGSGQFHHANALP